ncbi:MAG TPA: PEP-CTERM sorting domain-containing protein [Rhizomicrobium sp.]|nr:PEP-CTERM sorting domain-containing protein [Rhizomicrobium sp.]
MRITASIAFASALALAATQADAGVLYSQPGSSAACAGYCWTSSYGAATNSGFATFDDFTLSGAANVTSVSWNGFIWDPTGGGAGMQPGAFWYVYFFSDAGGVPGTNIYQEVVTPTATLLGSDTFSGDPVDVYNFTATLPTDFAAAGNTKYWFVPLLVQLNLTPLFSWSPSTMTADDESIQEPIPAGGYNVQPGDRAFWLFGNAVPEPFTLSLFGAGLAGAAVMRRRRKSKAAA